MTTRIRRRIDLSDGAHLEACLPVDVSTETLEVLRQLGEAVARHWREIGGEEGKVTFRAEVERP
ncbi:MAG TPA: hypothetical protein VKV02_14500 [Acidobacteriaceae bacterium]|nr:hypothetical protein [Acidobacteriaceae bacterium]